MWQRHASNVRRGLTAVKVGAGFVLVEQGYEVLVQGVSLAQNPLIVIAALGALGFPVPGDKDKG